MTAKRKPPPRPAPGEAPFFAPAKADWDLRLQELVEQGQLVQDAEPGADARQLADEVGMGPWQQRSLVPGTEEAKREDQMLATMIELLETLLETVQDQRRRLNQLRRAVLALGIGMVALGVGAGLSAAAPIFGW